MADHKKTQRPNWYRLAISRGIDRPTRQRAWKIILLIEVCGLAVVSAAFSFIPDSAFESTQALILIVIAAVLVIAVLAYSQR